MADEDQNTPDSEPRYAVSLAELHYLDGAYAGTVIVAVAADGSHVHAGAWGLSAKVKDGELQQVTYPFDNVPPEYVTAVVRAVACHVIGAEPMAKAPKGVLSRGGSA